MFQSCRKGTRIYILTNSLQVLSITSWSLMKRQDVSGGASLTYKVYLTDGTQPGPHGPMCLLLVMNIALWVHKCFRTMREWTILHFKKESSYPVTRTGSTTTNMSWPTFLAHKLATAQKQSSICRIGIEVKTVTEKIKRNTLRMRLEV